MRRNTYSEYALLGSLMSGPKHGYELMRFLGEFLESTWRVSASQLYSLLKRMEKEGSLRSSMEAQDRRPSKRVFELTRKGRSVFGDWLRRPVRNVRDIRTELIGKIFFFHQLRLSGASTLVTDQILILEEFTRQLLDRRNKEADPFSRLVYGYKLESAHSALTWLQNEAKPFVEKKQGKGGSIRGEDSKN